LAQDGKTTTAAATAAVEGGVEGRELVALAAQVLVAQGVRVRRRTSWKERRRRKIVLKKRTKSRECRRTKNENKKDNATAPET
jgi:hypothetical protein